MFGLLFYLSHGIGCLFQVVFRENNVYLTPKNQGKPFFLNKRYEPCYFITYYTLNDPWSPHKNNVIQKLNILKLWIKLLKRKR